MLSDREKLIRLPSSPSTRGICSQEVELDLFSQHTMFSRFASAARRAGRQARQLSTAAAAGDGSGFLIAGGVGVWRWRSGNGEIDVNEPDTVAGARRRRLTLGGDLDHCVAAVNPEA